MDKSTSPPPARANANNEAAATAAHPKPPPPAKHTLRGSGSYPTMIRARTANRKITKRSESVTHTIMMKTTTGGSSSPALSSSSGLAPLLHDRNRSSSSKKLKRMVYSRATRRKSLEHLGLLRRNRCGTAKLQWPSEKKETDAFDLLPEGCLQVRQLRLKSGNSLSQSANNDDDDDLNHDDEEEEDEDEITTSSPSKKKGSQVEKNNHPPNQNQNQIRNGIIGIDWKTKKNISVIVRIRPKYGREMEEKTIIFRTDSKTIVFDPKEKTKDFYFQGVKQTTRNDFGKKRPNKNMSFSYDKVYGPESTNQEIFCDSLANLTDHLMEGYNCTVFAYGSTGSGKTYTMLGGPANPGLTGLMVEALYKRLGEVSDHHDCEIIVSYLEVYNETIKDLLRPEKELFIREDGKRGIIIPELSHYKPHGPAELLKLLRRGAMARTQHATDMNHESSRSHAVFEVKLCLKKIRRKSSKAQTDDDGFDCDANEEFIDEETNKVEVIHSKLVMVDLAGSERGAGAAYDGARQREGASINKSLLALANCISALADGKAHIPYRNSKLTRLLKDALSGNCTTIMIANISPSAITSEDTYNTLKYADRAKSIVGPGSKQNMFLEDLMEEDSVKSQVAELQARLAQLEELLEEEKLKHEETSSMLVNSSEKRTEKESSSSSNFLLHFGGDGDGPQHVKKEKYLHNENNNSQDNDEKRSDNKSEQEIPAEIKKYIEKTSEWGHQFSNVVDKAHKARFEEWTTLTKKLKVDTADFFGRLPVGDENYVGFAKLKNEVVKLEQTVEDQDIYKAPRKSAGELRALTLEMERMEREFVDSLKNAGGRKQAFCGRGQVVDDDNKNGPGVTISLGEFLQFKRMLGEREVARKVEHSYHIFSQQINSQLMSSGMMLLHALKLLKTMHSLLSSPTKGLSSEIQTEYQQLLQLVYGPEQVVSTLLDRLVLSCSAEPSGNKNDTSNEGATAAGTSVSIPIIPNSLQSRRISSLIMDDFHNLAKLVERPLLTELMTEPLESVEKGDQDHDRLEVTAVAANCNSTIRLNEPNYNDHDQKGIGEEKQPFLISTENVYEPSLLLTDGESSENGGNDDDDDDNADDHDDHHHHSENDHTQLADSSVTTARAEESSSKESIPFPFYETFIPETEPEFMPHNNTATWTSAVSTALSEKPRKKPTLYEIRFENEKQSWNGDEGGDGPTGRKSINGLRRFPVKSNSISSTAAAAATGSLLLPPPLHKQKVSESREVGTSTTSNSGETIQMQQSKISGASAKQTKSIGKRRLVDQPAAGVIKDHQVSKDLTGLPQHQPKPSLLSVDIGVGAGIGPASSSSSAAAAAANNKKGFVSSDQQHVNAKSLRRLKSSRFPGAEETLLMGSKSKSNSKTTNPNPSRGQHHQHQNPQASTKPEITSEKRKPKLSQMMGKPKMNNTFQNTNNSNVGDGIGIGATGNKKLRGSGASFINTPSESQMNHFHQGQPKNPHHQYQLKHQQRLLLKVNQGKKSISQPPPLILHPSRASLNLLKKEKISCEAEEQEDEEHNDHLDTDVEQERSRKKQDTTAAAVMALPESARSSISHKAPYHTSSKTFTIRDHDHTLLPLGSIPIISARSNNSDEDDDDDPDNSLPLEVIYKRREQKTARFSSNEDEDDHDEEQDNDNASDDNNEEDEDEDGSSTTGSYSES